VTGSSHASAHRSGSRKGAPTRDPPPHGRILVPHDQAWAYRSGNRYLSSAKRAAAREQIPWRSATTRSLSACPSWQARSTRERSSTCHASAAGLPEGTGTRSNRSWKNTSPWPGSTSGCTTCPRHNALPGKTAQIPQE